MTTDKDQEYEHMLELLGEGGGPEISELANSPEFRTIARMVWDHGYDHGRAAQMDHQARELREQADEQERLDS